MFTFLAPFTMLAANATPALPQIFGIQLGAPLALPECSFTDNRPDLGYNVMQTQLCATKPAVRPDQPVPTVTIWWPAATAPVIVKNWNMRALVLDGVLAGVKFYTAGAADQDIVLGQLTGKFGQPTSITRTQVGNLAGASFAAIHARWQRPGFTVQFEGITDQVDFGEVTIDTPAAAARRSASEPARPAL